MEPLISLTILNATKQFPAGETLRWEFQIDAVKKDELQAVETSVLWYSEGKGEPELGVHYFQRHVKAESPDGDLRCLRRCQTVLPNSPLSYNGTLLKIEWCIRVRGFLTNGKTFVHDQPFKLHNVGIAKSQPLILQTA